MAQSGGSITEVVDDLTHTVRRSGMYMGAKSVIEFGAAEAIGGGQALASALSGVLTGAGASLIAIASLGGVAAVSASLAQMDYRHKRDKINDFYQEELAASAKDPAGKTQPNRTIDEALNKTKKDRNLGIALSVVASLTAFTLVTLVFAAAPHGLMMMAAKGLTGLMTYNAVKKPLKWLGSKAFGLDKETTHDHIVALKHGLETGKHITREQVFSVFIDANPELNTIIARESGAEFSKLTVEGREAAMQRIGQLINLNQLTDDINHHKVNVGELALAVDAQISGVRHAGPVEKPQASLLARAVEKCVNLAKSLRATPEPAPEPAVQTAPVAPKRAAPSTISFHHPADSVAPGANVARLGRGPSDKTLTALERLALRDNQPAMAGERSVS